MFDGVRTLDDEPPILLWNSGPRVQALYEILRREGLDPGTNGKGQSTWLAFGYVLATDVSRVIAIHDCDIRDYSRELLARLCFPTANPNLHYEFAKGYYGRVADRLYGRVTRLFVTPLLRAMKAVLGTHPLLEYLDSFRYPLAGECSMTTDLARINRIPSDWGLEIGTLVEVYRNCSLKRICQVELVENYDHRHQSLSVDDATQGLHRMVADIAASAIRNLASYGVAVRRGLPDHARGRLHAHRPGRDRGLQRRRAPERAGVRPPRGGAGGGDLLGRAQRRRAEVRARSHGLAADSQLEPRHLRAAGLPRRASRGGRSRRRGLRLMLRDQRLPGFRWSTLAKSQSSLARAVDLLAVGDRGAVHVPDPERARVAVVHDEIGSAVAVVVAHRHHLAVAARRVARVVDLVAHSPGREADREADCSRAREAADRRGRRRRSHRRR